MIFTRKELIALKKDLGVRADWHEPGEQGVTVVPKGTVFDNAGFSPPERSVILKQYGKPVAEVNLAILFAWATGYDDTHLRRRRRKRRKQ
jgi:hypothetical protein